MKLLSIIFSLLISTILFSQGGFKRQFMLPGVITHQSKGIYQKVNGDYIAGGIIVDTLHGNVSNRLAIMGLNANGQLLWTKKYGSYKFEYLDGLVAPWFYFDDNFMYHAGAVRDSLNKYYGVLIKFDINGDTLWQRVFKDSLESVVLQMVTKSVDGGLLISGCLNDPLNTNNNPVLVIKTDSFGGELWRKKINKAFPNDQDGKAILQDSTSKKIVIVGYQSIGNISGWSAYDNILILDSLGTKLSQHNFAGSTGGLLLDLVQAKDGKFVAVGQRIYPQMVGGTNLTRAFAVKFDVNTPNPPIWRNSYDQLQLTNWFSCITELENGDFLVGGTIDTSQLHNMLPNFLTRLTVLDKNGQQKSNRYYNYKTNSSSTDNFQSILCLNPTSDKCFISAINVQNTPNPNPFFFVKFDSTGCDSTPAYCANPVSLNEFYEKTGISFEMFPNPANEYLKFKVSNPTHAQFDIKINSLQGEEIEHLVFDKTGAAKVETRNFSAGIYLISFFSDDKAIETKKLIIVH